MMFAAPSLDLIIPCGAGHRHFGLFHKSYNRALEVAQRDAELFAEQETSHLPDDVAERRKGPIAQTFFNNAVENIIACTRWRWSNRSVELDAESVTDFEQEHRERFSQNVDLGKAINALEKHMIDLHMRANPGMSFGAAKRELREQGQIPSKGNREAREKWYRAEMGLSPEEISAEAAKEQENQKPEAEAALSQPQEQEVEMSR